MTRIKKSKILNNIKIQKIGYGGIGISRAPGGKTILIKGGALPGTTVDLRVVKEKKDYIEAHILSVSKHNPELLSGTPICNHFFSPFVEMENPGAPWTIGCGGCKRQIMAYSAQLKLKEEIVKDAFSKLSKQQEISFLPIVGSPLSANYRNKIEFSFGVYKQQTEAYKIGKKSGKSESELLSEGIQQYEIDSDFNLWFHKQGEFSKIVDIQQCGLISNLANQLFAELKELFVTSGLPVYDQKTHQGFFRHLVMRQGFHSDQILINLSVADNNLDEESTPLWEQLLAKLSNNQQLKEKITCFVISYNNGLADIVRNQETETKILRGEGYIYEKLLLENTEKTTETELTFRISPFSFFQTNTLGAEQLFSTAFKMLGHWEGNILDLYCWTGSIGLSLLKGSKENTTSLIGIEIVEEAIIDAWHNAGVNGLKERSLFLTTPAEKMLSNHPQLLEKIQNLGVVIIDPPREGLHPNVIKFLQDLKKEYHFKLLYISCNPITMARDIELLIQEGFIFKQIQPVDMFPHTHHIECISILS